MQVPAKASEYILDLVIFFYGEVNDSHGHSTNRSVLSVRWEKIN